jgi:hypothetical protein
MELKINRELNNKIVEAQGIIREATGRHRSKSLIIQQCVDIGFELWANAFAPKAPYSILHDIICTVRFRQEVKEKLDALSQELSALLNRKINTHQTVMILINYSIEEYLLPYLTILDHKKLGLVSLAEDGELIQVPDFFKTENEKEL